MQRKHIVKFGYKKYAFDTINAAATAVAFFSRLVPVERNTDGEYEDWHYAPKADRDCEISLESNQKFRDPDKPKSKKVPALPSPKRGTILCICERSYVAPRETCPHCGRSFSESHNRTHQDKPSGQTLRLI